MPSEQDIMTAEEAARYLKVSLRTLRELAGAGRIPARKVGREWRFSRSALETWISAIGSPKNRSGSSSKR
jgi:PTS system nitrogen regulatory IIA component